MIAFIACNSTINNNVISLTIGEGCFEQHYIVQL